MLDIIIVIVKVVLVTLYIAFMGQVILYPVEQQLHRIADFLDSFEITIDEKDDDVD